MNVENVEETKKIYLQSISYDTFLKIIHNVNLVDSIYMYSMSNHIKNYSNNVEETVQTIFSYYENEDEKWRIANMRQVELTINSDEEIVNFGGTRICDAALCICMPITNSIILVPGQKSIENGWDVTKIVQFTNMISMTPMLLKLMDVEDEENPPNHKISVSYEVIGK